MLAEEKNLKTEIKKLKEELNLKTKERVETLSDEEVKELLKEKWIEPLIEQLLKLPQGIVTEPVGKLEALTKKYETTLADVEGEIQEKERELASMLDQLVGSEFDMLGLQELKNMLLGAENA